MLNPNRWIPAALICLASLLMVPFSPAAGDLLDDVKARKAIEAQRVEKEFSEIRAAAYKLVRNDNPQLVDSSRKLQELMATLRADTSLEPRRRNQLIITIKADLDRVAAIAGERRRSTDVPSRRTEITRTIRDDVIRRDTIVRADSGKRTVDDIRSMYDRRKSVLDEQKQLKINKEIAMAARRRSIDESSIPPARDYNHGKNWPEISKRRSQAQKMTAKEKEIIKVLDSILNADYNDNTLEEVISHLRKATKVDIIVDKRALEEAGASYESKITLKLRSSTRFVLKRILSDLNLAYVVKDEAIQITSKERASKMTTTKTYYVGDLAMITDSNVSPLLSRALAIQKINTMINLITTNVEPQSWKVNNPDAVGVINFDPLTMSIIVTQNAEIHYKLGSR